MPLFCRGTDTPCSLHVDSTVLIAAATIIAEKLLFIQSLLSVPVYQHPLYESVFIFYTADNTHESVRRMGDEEADIMECERDQGGTEERSVRVDEGTGCRLRLSSGDKGTA